MNKKQGWLGRFMRDNLLALAVFAVVLALFIGGIAQAQQGSRRQGKLALETSIRRAVITCYSLEGQYPESLEYIKAHYGLHYDEKRYAVFYEVYASNLMPGITVVERVDAP
nr:hypothetical protein [bacterium]